MRIPPEGKARYWQLLLSADDAQLLMDALGHWAGDPKPPATVAVELLRQRFEQMGMARR